MSQQVLKYLWLLPVDAQPERAVRQAFQRHRAGFLTCLPKRQYPRVQRDERQRELVWQALVRQALAPRAGPLVQA
jgi:hypothetical protein